MGNFAQNFQNGFDRPESGNLVPVVECTPFGILAKSERIKEIPSRNIVI